MFNTRSYSPTYDLRSSCCSSYCFCSFLFTSCSKTAKLDTIPERNTSRPATGYDWLPLIDRLAYWLTTRFLKFSSNSVLTKLFHGWPVLRLWRPFSNWVWVPPRWIHYSIFKLWCHHLDDVSHRGPSPTVRRARKTWPDRSCELISNFLWNISIRRGQTTIWCAAPIDI